MWIAKCHEQGRKEPLVFVTNDLLRVLRMAADDYKSGLISSGKVKWTISSK